MKVQQGLDHLRQRYGAAAAGSSFTGSPAGETLRFGHMGPVQTEPRFILDLLDVVLRTWHDLGAHVDRRAGLRAARSLL